MKLVPTRPITILAETDAQRWFPYLFRHPDGTMVLYVQNGYDCNFAPFLRYRSVDGGRQWFQEKENVPRIAWAHWFGDGELVEIDNYGVLDPKTKDAYCYYGAWSYPNQPAQSVRRDLVRVHSPSVGQFSLTTYLRQAHYPTFPWWDLFNGLHGKSELTGDEVQVNSLYFTGGVEHDGRLLAFGCAPLRGDLDLSGNKPPGGSPTSVLCFQSKDRGHMWEEFSLVARGTRDTAEGFNETSAVQLKDGRLYAVFRSGGLLHQAWSSDGARTWTRPEAVRLVDSDHRPQMSWPICVKLEDGTLVMVYGRPGKHMIFDPSGTGTQWQGRLDLQGWEIDTQAQFGVPPELRLRGPTERGVRYWDSGDYLGCVAVGPRELLVCYDVQNYHEHWNSVPIAGVRMVRVQIEE